MKNNEAEYKIIADYYGEHYDEILGFVSKCMQYADGAEDIVQDVFVRLMRSDKMITPVTLPNLVYTVARNLVYDYWRHRVFVEEYEHYLASMSPRDGMDAASVYGVREMTELLERGMARLTQKQREVYQLNIYDGMQVSEISRTLHVNYKSVENRLGAARKEIRKYMARMLAS